MLKVILDPENISFVAVGTRESLQSGQQLLKKESN